MTKRRSYNLLWLIILCFAWRSYAQESQGFYRVVSTQDTTIISLDRNGSIVWSNEHSNASFRIEWASAIDAEWATNSMPAGMLSSSVMTSAIPLNPIICETGRVYCFESSYYNSFTPFNPIWMGEYIDSDGTLWAYDITDQDPQPTNNPSGVYTRAQLDAKYAGYSTIKGKVHRSSLARTLSLIPGASAGSMIYSDGPTDSGWHQIVGFIYNQSSNTYTSVLLSASGTFIGTNTSADAIQILDMLPW